MNENIYFIIKEKNIRTNRGSIINPLPVHGIEKIDDFFIVGLVFGEFDFRSGIIDKTGKILIPFDYYFILTDDNFATNNLLVAEDMKGNKLYINTKDFSISSRLERKVASQRPQESPCR
jgi:hypothetical protein